MEKIGLLVVVEGRAMHRDHSFQKKLPKFFHGLRVPSLDPIVGKVGNVL